jgi:hypothetical protein
MGNAVFSKITAAAEILKRELFLSSSLQFNE